MQPGVGPRRLYTTKKVKKTFRSVIVFLYHSPPISPFFHSTAMPYLPVCFCSYISTQLLSPPPIVSYLFSKSDQHKGMTLQPAVHACEGFLLSFFSFLFPYAFLLLLHGQSPEVDLITISEYIYSFTLLNLPLTKTSTSLPTLPSVFTLMSFFHLTKKILIISIVAIAYFCFSLVFHLYK